MLSKKKRNTLNFGTLNVRGCQEDYQRETIIEDMNSHDIQVLSVTETHINETDLEEYVFSRNKSKEEYLFYHTGVNHNHGVGLVIEKHLNPKFDTISERICIATIDIEEHHLNIISVYAPTMEVSEKYPGKRTEFYDQLDKTLKKYMKAKDTTIILGDFNAKTGSGYKEFKYNMGKFGKGKINSNGRHLLELLRKYDMYLTNTTFQHKMSHRTTWTAPERINKPNHYDGTVRRNPYRNQIDYIVVKNSQRNLVLNSRSYGGISTYTDHKLVKMNFSLNWWKLKLNKKPKKVLDVPKLHNHEVQEEYKIAIQNKYNETMIGEENPDDTWNRITTTCLNVAKDVIGYKVRRLTQYNNNIIRELSEKQKNLNLKVESTKDDKKRRSLRTERNRVINSLKTEIRKLEDEKIDKDLEHLESCKDDSNKYYRVMRELKSKKQKPLIVQDDKGLTAGNDKEKVKIVTAYFKKMFTKDDREREIDVPPKKMLNPFTAAEIYKSVKKLKNNKSAGQDEIAAEFIKYAPNEVHEDIAKLLNKMAETGNYPTMIRKGILSPNPKPNTKKGPCKNLRPITLLSILRKVLAVSLIERVWNRMKEHIPASQAAYQNGRSTTEHVFFLKMLAEKAITTSNYEMFILMLDMSKAFDTVDRKTLLKYLSEILEEDELHLMKAMISDVILNVRIGDFVGEDILTNVGICQGDCLSALLFILYLAKIKRPLPKYTIREDHDVVLWSDLDWLLPKKRNVAIDADYADDITFARSNKSQINQIKRMMPPMLEEGHLLINHTKTEEYEISIDSGDKWRKCKLLGSLLGTEEDIYRRRGLTIDAFKQQSYIFQSRKISKDIKLRVFKTYIESIFLYNSELWSLTHSMEDSIDMFQRKQYRKMLEIYWPNVITNDRLYEIVKCEKWSVVIRRRRLKWFGHMARLSEDTPAKLAFKEYIKVDKKPPGRPVTTWYKTVYDDIKDFSGLNIEFRDIVNTTKDIITVCQDRSVWRDIVRCIMLHRATNML